MRIGLPHPLILIRNNLARRHNVLMMSSSFARTHVDVALEVGPAIVRIVVG
jgi:hypothetical protein